MDEAEAFEEPEELLADDDNEFAAAPDEAAELLTDCATAELPTEDDWDADEDVDDDDVDVDPPSLSALQRPSE